MEGDDKGASQYNQSIALNIQVWYEINPGSSQQWRPTDQSRRWIYVNRQFLREIRRERNYQAGKREPQDVELICYYFSRDSQ